jgi:hypothetical protein
MLTALAPLLVATVAHATAAHAVVPPAPARIDAIAYTAVATVLPPHLPPSSAHIEARVDTTPMRAAQRALADALATADSVDYVRAEPTAVAFGIDRAGEGYTLVATIDARGRVVALEIDDVGIGHTGAGALSWLVDVAHDTRAIVQLVVDAGIVVVVTADGERYEAIRHAGRTNAAVEARWAAAWDV